MSREIACLDAAIEYAQELGWGVFPLNGKRPFPGTHGHLDATNERKLIRKLWRQFPDANVGVACSSQVGPIVTDVDGPEGIEVIKGLNLPETMMASSRRSKFRRHYYFGPSGHVVKRAIKVLPGLDILGDGGYVVAPPSIHPKTGKPYLWLNDLDPIPLPSNLLRFILANSNNGDRPHQAAPLPLVILEGKRDELLTSLAGSMRRRGASEEAILAALREENENRCNPPLSDRQIRKIAKSIARKKPVETTENLTDLGNARRFISTFHEDVRHVRTWKRSWVIWEGNQWSPDETGEVERMAKQTINEMYKEAATIEDDKAREAMIKHAMRSETSSRVKSLLDLASSEPEIATVPDVFDPDPWLLAVENGTINLKTGEFYQSRREDYITKVAPVFYDAKAKAPTWKRFLREITRGDRELLAYLQRSVGYALTGDTREQCLFFCYGTGQNGKSTFLEMIREMLGPYGQQADFSTFLTRASDGPRNDLARMRGVRMVTAIEASTDKSFDEGVLKQLTGGDTVTARRLYEEFFEFRPTHKIFLAANHKPRVSDQTKAFWRRIRLIPFTVAITDEEKDDLLPVRLRNEMSGILNWALEGCRKWQELGLGSPSVITEATQDYKEEEDLIGEFLAQTCELEKTGWTSTVALYQNFTVWWRESRGVQSRPPQMRWFTRALGERPELKSVKRRRVRGWKGISIKVRLV